LINVVMFRKLECGGKWRCKKCSVI